MSTFQPSTHLALEQATQFDSTGTPTLEDNSKDSSGTQDGILGDDSRVGDWSDQLVPDETSFEQPITLEDEKDLDSVQDLPLNIKALDTSGSSLAASGSLELPMLATTNLDESWTEEEDQELFRIMNRNSSKTKGGRFRWASIESSMQDFWMDTKGPGFTRVKGGLKGRVARLKALQEAGLTPTTYKPRPFTPQEDSQILALQPDQLHNSSKKPSINWELATQQFVARLKFELKERRIHLLAMEKRKLKTVEREKKKKQARPSLVRQLTGTGGPQASRPRSRLPPASQISTYGDKATIEGTHKLLSHQMSSTSVSREFSNRFPPSFDGSPTCAPPYTSSASPLHSLNSWSGTHQYFSQASNDPSIAHCSPSNDSSFKVPTSFSFPRYDIGVSALASHFEPDTKSRKRSNAEFELLPFTSRKRAKFDQQSTSTGTEKGIDLLVDKDLLGEGLELFATMRKRQDEWDLEFEEATEGKN
ncbi:hypothetical protein JCM5350_003900 [Sporobolomyces pararoseus]